MTWKEFINSLNDEEFIKHLAHLCKQKYSCKKRGKEINEYEHIHKSDNCYTRIKKEDNKILEELSQKNAKKTIKNSDEMAYPYCRYMMMDYGGYIVNYIDSEYNFTINIEVTYNTTRKQG